MTQHKSKNGINLLGNSFQFVSGEPDLVVMGGEGTDTHSHTPSSAFNNNTLYSRLSALAPCNTYSTALNNAIRTFHCTKYKNNTIGQTTMHTLYTSPNGQSRTLNARHIADNVKGHSGEKQGIPYQQSCLFIYLLYTEQSSLLRAVCSVTGH